MKDLCWLVRAVDFGVNRTSCFHFSSLTRQFGKVNDRDIIFVFVSDIDSEKQKGLDLDSLIIMKERNVFLAV